MKYLFLHGLGQTAQSWDAVISCLYLPTDDVISVDLYKLIWDADKITYNILFNAFEKYCNSFCEPLCLCGLSLGGILAMDYALHYSQKVKTLILIGVQYKMPKAILDIQNAVFRLLPGRMFESIGLSKQNYISLANSMKKLDFTDELQKINMEVLVVFGERDRANKRACIELARKLQNADYRMIEKARHEVNVNNHSQLAEIIRAYIEKIT